MSAKNPCRREKSIWNPAPRVFWGGEKNVEKKIVSSNRVKWSGSMEQHWDKAKRRLWRRKKKKEAFRIEFVLKRAGGGVSGLKNLPVMEAERPKGKKGAHQENLGSRGKRPM